MYDIDGLACSALFPMLFLIKFVSCIWLENQKNWKHFQIVLRCRNLNEYFGFYQYRIYESRGMLKSLFLISLFGMYTHLSKCFQILWLRHHAGQNSYSIRWQSQFCKLKAKYRTLKITKNENWVLIKWKVRCSCSFMIYKSFLLEENIFSC